MASKRKKISTGTRFEVFKRDSFTCQYCGRAAPTVLLELEHIHPHSKGGSDDILNLITSCWECNSGKGARTLADDTVVKKQHDQLSELQARREQIDMLMRWRDGLVDLKADELAAAERAYKSRTPGWGLSDVGMGDLRKLVNKHGLARVLEAIDRAADRYIVIRDGKATPDSADFMFKMVRIFSTSDDEQILYRCRGIAKSRCRHWFDPKVAWILLRRAQQAGASHDQLLSVATDPSCCTWSSWKNEMETLISELEAG